MTATATVPLTCAESFYREDGDEWRFSDSVLSTNVASLLKCRVHELAGVVRGKANLCWAKRGQDPCNRWCSREEENKHEVVPSLNMFCFNLMIYFFFLKKLFCFQVLSTSEVEGMTFGQSRQIAKVLQRLSKLDEQTANEISLLAELYF